MLFMTSNDEGEMIVNELSKDNFDLFISSRNKKEMTFTELKEALASVLIDDDSLFQYIKERLASKRPSIKRGVSV